MNLNPPNAQEHLSTNGSDWLWTVFSIMALSALLAAFATVLVSAFLYFRRTLFLSIVVVVTGLVGALVHSTYKWGYYTFGVVALIYLWYVHLLFI